MQTKVKKLFLEVVEVKSEHVGKIRKDKDRQLSINKEIKMTLKI